MSTSTNAVLAYGYNLGGDDAGWTFRETGEYGEPNLDWYDNEAEDDFATAAEARLLASVGLTEKWGDNPDGGFWEREKAAKARLAVELDSYCHVEHPMYVLAAKVITVYRGDAKILDPTELAAIPPEWDERLAAAVAALGITPDQERPGWVLVSYWG
ncbi:hypothetical protein J7F03_20680 [Streptomyces sp. ISL-43]|uniref:hypothetical protein n=1 Tax=Streptomyces sp. ISL-43 TaxID=2819183 RepID=UPI001BEA91CD|nr:hypothetical protein [Streptomyces sp. ISL-43]MBT2449459.1 hypothetical protein [Streptomyces sp. ISL-43]